MFRVLVGDKILFAENGQILSRVLIENGIKKEHPCGGRGICKKCLVSVNGENKLSCQYKIESDINVQIDTFSSNMSLAEKDDFDEIAENTAFVLDIGTTTLSLALVSVEEEKIINIKTVTNPQCVFGADVISRIDYCEKNGVGLPQKALIDEINRLINKFNVKDIKTMYVAGNTVMLHIFFGCNPESIGVAPYTPVFLDMKTEKGENIGIVGAEKIVALPSFSPFVGADLVAGINFVPKASLSKYNFLIDLGTNAEIILYSDKKILCTAAAAGPCFEGANISCGMSAVDGAISEFSSDGKFKTIGNIPAKGICGTGLVDIISFLLENKIIDETGFMECQEYEIANGISFFQDDVRQYQLAKSAIYSAVLTLMKNCGITFDEIDKVFISGGFSSNINIKNAIKTGLLPKNFENKCINIGNSSLMGTAKYAYEKNDLTCLVKLSEYIDLSFDESFSNLFIKNMSFAKGEKCDEK